MVKERRTAADALALSPQIEEFIAKGISSSAGNAKQPISIAPKVGDQDRRKTILPSETDSTSDQVETSQQEVGEAIQETRATFVGSERKEPTRTAGFSVTDEMHRMLSKATVQKTVRFHPQLIAQMEAWVKRREDAGETPLSFQQIQNEALKIWLDKNGFR